MDEWSFGRVAARITYALDSQRACGDSQVEIRYGNQPLHRIQQHKKQEVPGSSANIPNETSGQARNAKQRAVIHAA